MFLASEIVLKVYYKFFLKYYGMDNKVKVNLLLLEEPTKIKKPGKVESSR